MNTKILTGVIALSLLVGVVWYVADKLDQVHLSEIIEEDHHDEGDDDEVESYEIYPGKVADMIANNADFVLLDVRTIAEYEEIHLEGAVLLPVQELSQQALNEIGLGADAKDKEIIIYCRSGARSKTAYDIMTSLGYTNVKSSAGGMVHWEEDEYLFTVVGDFDASVNMVSESTSEVAGAKLEIARTLYDFGEIPQYGGVVEATFVLTNIGSETLEIGTLTTSCSCTSATVEQSIIEPGDSAELTVVFDPDFHSEPLGVFKRTVFIPTNDPNNPELEVAVQVDILEGE